jgi:muramidase (phage lysozyme)
MTVYAFDPTVEEKSILGQIRLEQSNGAYNILFGGGHFAGWTNFPQWAGKVVNGQPTHAAGAYQFEPATWQGIVAGTGVPDFTPKSQDIGALWLLRTYGQDSQWGTEFTDDGYVYVFAA